jgi:hypothetical protein
MPTVRSGWVLIDMSPTVAVANQNQLVTKPCPVEGVVREVWMSINTRVTTGGGIVTVHKNAVNLLSATNVQLASAATDVLASGTAASLTLSTYTKNLEVSTTDTFKALWTLTTVAITNGVGCTIVVEPTAW